MIALEFLFSLSLFVNFTLCQCRESCNYYQILIRDRESEFQIVNIHMCKTVPLCLQGDKIIYPKVYYTHKMSSWSRDDVRYLISLYKERPCLYDPKNVDFNSREIRAEKYNEIYVKIKKVRENITLSHLKGKIKTLQKQISRVKRKIKQNTASKETYKPVLWCFKELSFLLDIEEDDSIYIDSDESGAESSSNASVNRSSSNDMNKSEAQSISNTSVDRSCSQDMNKSIETASAAKSKVLKFVELLADELMEFKHEEMYENVVKKIWDLVYEHKAEDRRLPYEANVTSCTCSQSDTYAFQHDFDSNTDKKLSKVVKKICIK